MLILAALTAHATPGGDFACVDLTLADALPSPDHTVTAGFLPALVFDGGCGFAWYEVLLHEAGNPTPVAIVTSDGSGIRQVGTQWLAEPELPLEANTDYQITVSGDLGQQAVLEFSTDARTATRIDGVPEVVLLSLTSEPAGTGSWTMRAEVEITPAGTDNAVFILRANGVDRAVTVQAAAGPFMRTLTWMEFAERDGPACVDIIERDGTGAWHGPSAEACLDSNESADEVRGCNTAPAPLAWFSLPLLLLAHRRR